MHKPLLMIASAIWLLASAANAESLVVCSPGSPGTTDEAQPRMDALAAALSKSGTQVTAVYDPTEKGGMTRLQTSGLGLVSLPFFLQHESELGLHARAIAVYKGRPALDRWAVVAGKGRGLDGATVVTSQAFAPAFVHGVILGGSDAKLSPSSAVLSALRKAANGDPVAVVLDGTQEASLATLPFADKLEVVKRSEPVPVGLVVTIDARMKTWSGVENGFLNLDAGVLEALQLARFVKLDGDGEKALDAARKAFARK